MARKSPKKEYVKIPLPCPNDECGKDEGYDSPDFHHPTLDYRDAPKIRKEPKGGCWTCDGKKVIYRKEQVFLCIGGKHNGKKMNRSALMKRDGNSFQFDKDGTVGGYLEYNAASRGEEPHHVIWLHKSLFPNG